MKAEALDTQLQMVADVRRRELLLSLFERGAQNDGTRDGSVSMHNDESQCRIALHHNHLPKLAEAGFVSWDRGAGRVSRGPKFDDVRPLLTLLVENEDELSGQIALQ